MVETIGVRFIDRTHIKDFIKNELNNINVIYKYDESKNIIFTENLNIKCIIVPVCIVEMFYIRGMRFPGCIGFVTDEAIRYLTNGSNICEGYDLLGYILKKKEERLK